MNCGEAKKIASFDGVKSFSDFVSRRILKVSHSLVCIAAVSELEGGFSSGFGFGRQAP
jgi:hypothetical protein